MESYIYEFKGEPPKIDIHILFEK